MRQVGAEVAWHYYVGLDLGQRRDPTAMAVLEAAQIVLDEIDWGTYERRLGWRYRIRFLERVRLETAYPDVVERVRQVTHCRDLAGRCTLVLDATGVGAPVVDMLRRANLGCAIEPVIITGGERESYSGGVWSVPKHALVTGLQVMLENGELGLSNRVPAVGLLLEELAGLEARVRGTGRVSYGAYRAGEHDDLVMAATLAWWRARRPGQRIFGTKSLGLV